MHLSAGPGLLPLNGLTLVVPVHGEIPAPSAAIGVGNGTSLVWTLLHTPAYGASCFRNGTLQNPASDYTLAGNVITAPAWVQGDWIACEFEYTAQ